MHRHLLPPFIAPTASNTISLFCLAIAILSFTTQYILNLHLTNMCNTICLIFLAASIATRMPPSNPVTRVPDDLQTLLPSPSIGTPPSPLTPHDFLLCPDAQGAHLYGNGFRTGVYPLNLDPNSFLDLTSEESFQGTVSRWPVFHRELIAPRFRFRSLDLIAGGRAFRRRSHRAHQPTKGLRHRSSSC